MSYRETLHQETAALLQRFAEERVRTTHTTRAVRTTSRHAIQLSVDALLAQYAQDRATNAEAIHNSLSEAHVQRLETVSALLLQFAQDRANRAEYVWDMLSTARSHRHEKMDEILRALGETHTSQSAVLQQTLDTLWVKIAPTDHMSFDSDIAEPSAPPPTMFDDTPSAAQPPLAERPSVDSKRSVKHAIQALTPSAEPETTSEVSAAAAFDPPPFAQPDYLTLEILPYLVLHPDGVSLDELTRDFNISRGLISIRLKRLIDIGKARRDGILYTAV